MPRLLARSCLILSVLLGAALPARAGEGTVFTLWPLVDYRSSPRIDYVALHLLGPLVKWERKDGEREFALRPLIHSSAAEEEGQTDLLFPLVQSTGGRGFDRIGSIGLLEDEERRDDVGGGHTFTLFPFLFYDRHADRETSLALFPVGGRLVRRFWRDDIRFALFPLYSRTRKGTTTVTNVLWPVFASVSGEGESGFKFWPLYGASEKEGNYRKRFMLWPFFYANDLDLDGENPRRQRGFFPFYTSDSSPRRTTRVYLWPLFSFREDHEKGYKEWSFPWPLLGVVRGEGRHTNRFLPLYADERRGDYRKRWVLWPLYRFEATDSERMRRSEHRALFFLYRDLQEAFADEEGVRRRRIFLWPLLRYQQRQGVSHLSLLALLEPFFPESDGVERNWAPLWRLYQAKWDGHGNRVDSLLWNLFWREKRPDAVAGEVFPVLRWSLSPEEGTDVSLLKGLLRYRNDAGEKTLNLLYLPWGMNWGNPVGHANNG